MALVFVDVVQKCGCCISVCDNVYVCLTPEWADRTVSGFALAAGRIVTINDWADPSGLTNCCNCTDLCADKCIYQIEINDNQFLINPSTNLPWQPTSVDITELIPYACIIQKLIDGILSRPDWVLDCSGVALTPSIPNNNNVLSIPIIDRVSGDPITSCPVTFPGETLVPDNGDSELTFTSSSGQVTVIDVCALIANCPAFVAPTLDPGAPAPSGTSTLVYSNGGDVIYQGPSTIISNNNCSSGGVGSAYAINDFDITGTVWTINGAPEHFAIAESIKGAQQNYSTAPEIASIMTGDSSITTAAFISTTFFNPSPCRDCRCLIIATGSFAGSSTAGSGTVVWGHSLWINGVLIANRDGRSVPDFNISWSDSIGFLADYTIPPIVIEHQIPAGGSVTIGLDFGDNENFPTVGTGLFVSLESRQITIVGGTI